jgi:cyclic pyranopterin phosphate synthase
MDVGETNGWRMTDVVSGEEILERVRRVHPLLDEAPDPSSVAKTYRFADGNGDLGVITSVSRPFCGDCTRARLGVDGKLYTCLFATSGIDLRESLRSGADDDALRGIIADRWKRRDDRYSELRGLGIAEGGRIEMSYIGG